MCPIRSGEGPCSGRCSGVHGGDCKVGIQCSGNTTALSHAVYMSCITVHPYIIGASRVCPCGFGSPEGSVKQVRAAVLGGLGKPVDFRDEGVSFGIDLGSFRTAHVGGSCLCGKLFQTCQHVFNLLHAAFSHLQEGIGFRGVP